MDIRLRAAEIGDIDDDYCRWYENTDGHLDFFSGSGRVFHRESLLADFTKGLETQTWFYYVIEEGSGTRVGNVRIGPIDRRNQTADMACLIGNRAFLNKGIATRAVSLAIEIAFHAHGIRRLHTGMYATNVASIKAYTKAGYYIEGTFKGFYLVNGAPIDRVCMACLNPAFVGPGAGPGVPGQTP